MGAADADRDGSSRRKTVEAAMNDIDQAASACIHFINTRQQSASKDMAQNLAIVALLLAIAVLAAEQPDPISKV